ncbi:hypothetical protein FK268_09145 [Tsukamurella sputi]|uniref:Minor tail protein n=1 Tax=Tsukamurella sputi TaxID=2591848 RepID=A0A5C5RQS2_9ACTN|nr:hypothetical protein [Tsukamurella sputi]TWS25347.1 hypothetical protein FK268_09145 [Tsukamurella sputi]
MNEAKIEIESSRGYAKISDRNGEFGDEGLELDQSPTGMFSTEFTTRTVSGNFEVGGRVTGQTVPIRQMVLPINCYEMPGQSIEKTISNLRKLFGSPLDRRKVKWTYTSELSGPRWLIVQLASEIKFSPQRDWNIDGFARAVVTVLAEQPMYESQENVQTWSNPNDRFIVTLKNGLLGGPQGNFTLSYGGQTTGNIAVTATAATVKTAVEGLSSVGAGQLTVTGSAGGPWTFVFTGVTGTLTANGAGMTRGSVKAEGASIGYFTIENPTDQIGYPEWDLDPAQWQFPDFSFGQERMWKRPAGADAARMIVTKPMTQRLSVMSDPMMDPYLNEDLSTAAGDFDGVMPMYGVPPYTPPTIVPVVCNGPAGAKAMLTLRRLWSAESGME